MLKMVLEDPRNEGGTALVKGYRDSAPGLAQPEPMALTPTPKDVDQQATVPSKDQSKCMDSNQRCGESEVMLITNTPLEDR